MTTDIHIRYLKRQEIDTSRWDACVARSANRLIYGFHDYLDVMTSGQWNALICNDYQAVMPLTWRRKYGIAYLAQPAFTQQTGIFAPEPPSAPLIDAFLQATAGRYSFAEIFLNHANSAPALETRVNLVLPLEKPYDGLASRYSDHLRRILRRTPSLEYTSAIPLDEALEANRKLYQHRNGKPRDSDYRNFDRLCSRYREKDQLILRAVKDDRSQWLAMALLLRDAHRLYLLQSTALPAGRDKGANHFLLDRLIHEFSGHPLLLDFEGSDDPGIARFYAGFGGVDQPYFFYRYNALPWPLRLFKSPLKAPFSSIPQPGQDRPAL